MFFRLYAAGFRSLAEVVCKRWQSSCVEHGSSVITSTENNHMKSFQQSGKCNVSSGDTKVIEMHYGLETLHTYRGCTISGAYRYEIEPNPRAIYVAYAFKNKSLLFSQVLEVPIRKVCKRDPLKIKEHLERLALRYVMGRLRTGSFQVGGQYNTPFSDLGEYAFRLQGPGVPYEDLIHDDRVHLY